MSPTKCLYVAYDCTNNIPLSYTQLTQSLSRTLSEFPALKEHLTSRFLHLTRTLPQSMGSPSSHVQLIAIAEMRFVKPPPPIYPFVHVLNNLVIKELASADTFCTTVKVIGLRWREFVLGNFLNS